MNRSTAAFLLVALSLGAYIYLVEPKQKSTAEQEKIEKRLFDFTGDRIRTLKITNGETTVAMVKKDGAWQIERPIVYPADASVVDQLISELESVETKRTFPYKEITDAAETLKKWGLTTPSIKIEFQGENLNQVLLIGRKTAVSDMFYARASLASDAPIQLISGTVKTNLDKKLDDLRNRSLWKWTTPEVRKITFRTAGGDGASAPETEVALQNNLWSLNKPISARGDAEQIQSWLGNVMGLRVAQFISEDSSNLNTYGLSSPKAQLTFHLNDGKEENTLLIGSAVPDKPTEVYAKRLKSNTVFTLTQEAVQRLIAGVSNWRNHQVMSFKPEEVTSVRLETKGRIFVAKKEQKAWKMSLPVDQALEGDLLNGFLAQLQQLKASAFIKDTKTDLKTYGLDKPTSKVILELKRGDQTEKLELDLGKADKTYLYASIQSEPFILGLPLGFGADFPKEPWQWRSLQVLEIPAEQMKAIQMAEKGARRFKVVRGEDGLYISENSKEAVERTSMSLLVSQLSQLRAVRWVGPVLPAYELSQPAMRFVISLPSGEKSLRIGAPLPTGGRAAQVDGSDLVFEIAKPDADLLNQKIISEKKIEAPVAPPPTSP